MKYITKPFEIEAVQFKFKQIYVDLLNATFGDDAGFDLTLTRDALGEIVGATIYDYLQDTWVGVNPGDYIIKGMKGEYYPCAEDVFTTKYQPKD